MGEKWPRDRWLDAIWEDPTLKPTERAVAYVYARYAGDGETSWCSYPEVMRRTGMRDRTTISNALKTLVKHGWLSAIAGARQHRSAVYRLTCPLEQSAFPTGQQSGNPTDAKTGNGSAVGIFDASRRDFRPQQSGYWDPSTQIDNSEENSDTALASLAREHEYVEGGFRLCKCGLPKHRHKAAAAKPYTNPPPGAYASWTEAQNINEGDVA